MAGTNLLALIDDIATLLDDVSALSKTAASKTAGVLGDDLALNAEQVAGVRPERELPVVWAVAKGSALNKLILVPSALALSAFLPFAVAPLLMAGGGYLCFEGFEKVVHHFGDKKKGADHELTRALAGGEVDIAEFEREKIKGAIFTDLILSAEIVVIALGTVQEEPLLIRALVMAVMATVLTVGVYTLVAAIVKLDDLGLMLSKGGPHGGAGIRVRLGEAILWFAPRLLKALGILGTIAMFLVGGGIWVHGIPPLSAWLHGAEHIAGRLPHVGTVLGSMLGVLVNASTGLIVGALALSAVHVVASWTRKPKDSTPTD